MEAKPMASLSSGLLARKGAARPAMRRPVTNGSGGNAAALAQDDLGWNDMGYDVNPDQSVPMDHDHNMTYNPLANAVPEAKPDVRIQQERIAEQLNIAAEEMGVAEPQDFGSNDAYMAEFIAPERPIIMPPAPVVAAVVEAAPVAEMPAAPQITAKKQFAEKAPVRRPRAAPGQKDKSAFTLRLDGDRHLKLRLACAVSNKSAQQLVTAALDSFMAAMPEINQLAAQVPSKKDKSN